MTEIELANLAGSIAGICSVSGFFPQMYRIIKRRSADDVSLSMYVIIMAGTVLWIFYAYVHSAIALLTTNVIIFFVCAAIAALRVRFGRRSRGSPPIDGV